MANKARAHLGCRLDCARVPPHRDAALLRQSHRRRPLRCAANQRQPAQRGEHRAWWFSALWPSLAVLFAYRRWLHRQATELMQHQRVRQHAPPATAASRLRRRARMPQVWRDVAMDAWGALTDLVIVGRRHRAGSAVCVKTRTSEVPDPEISYIRSTSIYGVPVHAPQMDHDPR